MAPSAPQRRSRPGTLNGQPAARRRRDARASRPRAPRPGYDTLYFRAASDGRLLAVVLAECRRLLTRDAALARRAREAGLLVRGTSSLVTWREARTCTGCSRVSRAGTRGTGTRRGSTRSSAMRGRSVSCCRGRGCDVAGDTRADCGFHPHRNVTPQASSRLRMEASGQNGKIDGTLADETTCGAPWRSMPAWPGGVTRLG